MKDGAWQPIKQTPPGPQLCQNRQAGARVCLCTRRRPGARPRHRCGSCQQTFLPSRVDGEQVGDGKSENRGVNKGKDKNQSKSQDLGQRNSQGKSTGQSKKTGGSGGLVWWQVAEGERCRAGEGEPGRGSPSVLCSAAGTTSQVCVCASKNNKTKHVCGDCILSLKHEKEKKKKEN